MISIWLPTLSQPTTTAATTARTMRPAVSRCMSAVVSNTHTKQVEPHAHHNRAHKEEKHHKNTHSLTTDNTQFKYRTYAHIFINDYMPFSVLTIREREREILNIRPFLPHHCRQKSGLKLPCAKTSPKT